ESYRSTGEVGVGGQDVSIIKDSALSETFLMTTQGGGTHLFPTRRSSDPTTLECLWVMPRDPDADMCPSTETVLVSTEECMAHQSCVRSATQDRDASKRSEERRVGKEGRS